MKKRVIQVVILFLLCVFLLSIVSAHEEETNYFLTKESLTKISLFLIVMSSINALLWVIISSFSKKKKKAKFLAIIIPIILTSIFLIITTIFINLNAETKGPVHWHADYEVWACGEKLNIINPSGLSNKVGTNLFHEHNDDRIHIDGVVEDIEEVNIEHFFEVIGGQISSSGISLITNKGFVSYKNGEVCNGTLQIFVYTTKNKEMQQTKVKNFLEYIPSPYSEVPPGDCIIIEFAEEKETTEQICETYKIALEKGEIHGS